MMKAASRVLDLGLIGVVCVSLFATAHAYADGDVYHETVFVSNYGRNEIYKFDGTTKYGVKFVGASDGLNGPAGLCFDRDGYLWVANYKYTGGATDADILVFDQRGNVWMEWHTGIPNPMSIACDSQNNMYVGYANGTILKFVADDGHEVYGQYAYPNPYGLACDRYDNLYVAGGVNPGEIWRIDAGGGTVTLFAQGDFPHGLARLGANDIYVSEYRLDAIGECNYYGTMPEKVDILSKDGKYSGLYMPMNLAFDYYDNLYVVSCGNNSIMKFDVWGGGVEVHPRGDGEHYGETLPGDDPWGIAILIPEPSSWALVALGTVVLLGSRRLHCRWS